MIENMQANRWYDSKFDRVNNVYPTPQAVLRLCVGTDTYKFIAEGVTSDHIRAAVILDPSTPFSHLMETPWAMNYKTDQWRMIIVSVLNIQSWLDLALSSGAIALYKASSMTVTYQWEMHQVDSQFNIKVRPANALGVTTKAERHEDGRKVRVDRDVSKKYNRENVLADLHLGQMTHYEIGQKHGVSRITVFNIAKREGIKGKIGWIVRVTS